MIISILWLFIIIAAVISQWHIIERLQKYPNKWHWLGIRVLAFGLFETLYILNDIIWYWGAAYLITSFALLFPMGLNWMRGKSVNYRSAINSWYDRALDKIGIPQGAINGFLFVLSLASIGLIYFYGGNTWYEVNNGIIESVRLWWQQ